MASVSPKTIIITTSSGRVPNSCSNMLKLKVIRPIMSSSPATGVDLGTESYLQSGPRKRRRLTHLTTEDRILRRKLKNRVAAQTARDRKKQRMVELEDELVIMQTENQRLAKANKALRQQSVGLRQENSQLRARLAGSDVVSQKEHVSPESAAGIDTCSLSPDNALPLVPSDHERDLLGFLAQLTDVPTGPVTAGIKQEVADEDCHATESTASLVGPTTAELESCKELIQFDHVYYKPPTTVATTSGVHAHQLPVVQVPGHHGQQSLLKPTPASGNSCKMECDIDTNVTSIPSCVSDMDFELNINDIMELSNSLEQLGDLEALLKDDTKDRCPPQPKPMPQAVDMKQEEEVIVIPDEEPTPKQLETCHRDTKMETNVISILDTSDLCVPDASYELLSHLELHTAGRTSTESGYSSELSDALSPKSDISSMQDDSDNMWEDSFTELFPSLM